MSTQPLGPQDPRRIGPYKLLARLGAGGMGAVFLGRSAGGRTVAIKLVHAELSCDPEFRRRFRHEVQSAREVGGEFTARVLDADTEAETPWLATAYIAGPTLHEVVDDGYGPLPERSLRPLAAGLGGALRAVHDRGLVHRDLKPSNVLLTLDGPRVIDFGIARAVDSSIATRTGAVIGTPAFMSPEQVRGERVTSAGDVFSLGSVLAFAATGRLPFATENGGLHSLMMRIVQAEPDLDGLDGPLLELVEACLAKDAGARPSPEEIIERAGSADDGGPWLPAEVVAGLGRHAVALLDLEDPDGAADERPSPPPPPVFGPAAPAPPPAPAPPGMGPGGTAPIGASPSTRPPAPWPGVPPQAGGAPSRGVAIALVAMGTLLVVAMVSVAVIVATDRDEKADATPPLVQAPRPASAGTPSRTGEDVPPEFIGTWVGTISGSQTRRMVIRQGREGSDVVTTRTTSGQVECEGVGRLVSATERTLVLSTRVTSSVPAGRCVAVGRQTLTLTGDDTASFQGGGNTGTLRKS
ncbi:hypothetical protein GCM10010191_27820 [Actinomadura vinacea]|uniref:Protein kinase domain-containing protein n=1 Tax=Actinomadura vinacea TaxID=115336 RepID=A0ABN3IWE7_9ACTN